MDRVYEDEEMLYLRFSSVIYRGWLSCVCGGGGVATYSGEAIIYIWSQRKYSET